MTLLICFVSFFTFKILSQAVEKIPPINSKTSPFHLSSLLLASLGPSPVLVVFRFRFLDFFGGG